MFYLNGINLHTYHSCPPNLRYISVLVVGLYHKKQFHERKFTYSDFRITVEIFISGHSPDTKNVSITAVVVTSADRLFYKKNSRRSYNCWELSLYLIIVQKESVIIVLLKCAEIILFSSIILHFPKCSDLLI